MRVLAWILTAWTAWRWLGLCAGVLRIRHFAKGPVRREAKRSCVGRLAWNVLWTLVLFLAWMQALGLRPRPNTTGFLGGMLMVCIAAGVATFFMQPEERTPETLTIFKLTRTTPKRE